MKKKDTDVLIIGAGAAGLAAAWRLRHHQRKRVQILEARNRIGGRILTLRDGLIGSPIELGAEFVHGSPREILDFTDRVQAPLILTDTPDRHLFRKNGKAREIPDFWKRIDRVMKHFKKCSIDRDISVHEAMRSWKGATDTRELALSFIEGFHAADPNLMSSQFLAKSEDQINESGGYRIARFQDGYASLLERLLDSSEGPEPLVRLNTVVKRIRWRAGHVEAHAQSPLGCDLPVFRAKACIVTVPVSVLRDPSAIEFDPPLPREKREALRLIEMGSIAKIVLRFDRRFWEKQQEDLSFIHGSHLPFPTWWTALPARLPVLTAWAGGPLAADMLNSSDEKKLARLALHSLAKLFDLEERRLGEMLVTWHFHDWQKDEFSRGAYSYVVVGGAGAQSLLSAPIDGTLSFAGEATHTKGQTGTVDAAMASGYRAADDVA